MQKILKITIASSLVLLLAACGGGGKEKNGDITELKTKIEKLKKEKSGLDAQLLQLEEQLAKIDPNAAKQARLVTVDTISMKEFTHFIELQGKIDAQNIAYVAPKGQGGQVRAIFVKQGDNVRKGQAILKLDDALARQGLVAAQQGLSGLKAQLAQAQSIYQRQQNLWKENIGTEIQVLNAKTNVESLQSQLNSAEANVQAAAEQVNQSTVTAGISGTVDEVNVKVGEFFSPQSAAGGAGIRIVNTGDLKVLAQVPENYLGRVQVGSLLQVTLPEAGNKMISSKVTVVSKLIDPTNRSFYIEGKMPQDKDLHPNQIAVVEIRDYTAASTITVPLNIVQSDENGKYVYVMEKAANGKSVAKKKQVTVGESYKGAIEIKTGLTGGEVIITEGYQTLYDGQAVATVLK